MNTSTCPRLTPSPLHHLKTIFFLTSLLLFYHMLIPGTNKPHYWQTHTYVCYRYTRDICTDTSLMSLKLSTSGFVGAFQVDLHTEKVRFWLNWNFSPFQKKKGDGVKLFVKSRYWIMLCTKKSPLQQQNTCTLPLLIISRVDDIVVLQNEE